MNDKPAFISIKKFPDKLVDLIYLDPPFFSNK